MAARKAAVPKPGGLPPQPTGYEPNHNYGLWAMRMAPEDMGLVRQGAWDEVCRRAKKPYALTEAAKKHLALAVENEIRWRATSPSAETRATIGDLKAKADHLPPAQTTEPSVAKVPTEPLVFNEPPSSAGHLIVVTGDYGLDDKAFPDACRAVSMAIKAFLENRVDRAGRGGLVISGGVRGSADLYAAGHARLFGHAFLVYADNGEKGQLHPTGKRNAKGQERFEWRRFGRWCEHEGDELSALRAMVDRAHLALHDGWKVTVWTFVGWGSHDRSDATTSFFEHLGFHVNRTHVSKEGALLNEVDEDEFADDPREGG